MVIWLRYPISLRIFVKEFVIPRRRQLATIERDQQALAMRRKGRTLWEIGRSFGVSAAAVSQMIDRAIYDLGRSDTESEQLVMLAKLDDAERELWKIIEQPHYRTTITGALIT